MREYQPIMVCGISTNGCISLYCFCVNLTVVLVPCLGFLCKTLKNVVEEYWVIMSLVYSYGIQAHLYMVYKEHDYTYKIAWRAGALGNAFGFGLLVCFLAPKSWCVFGVYISLLSFFHFSEYLTTAIINPRTLSLQSFLLNHSLEYGLAAIGGWLEFCVERHFFPHLKLIWWVSGIGLLLCVGGEILRKSAMFTAGTNFNHIIQNYRHDGHVLVTHGPYAWSRHPSYVGWFWWSVGTQILLCNPLCTSIYAFASWRFFSQRVYQEEITLLNFFGERYVDYQKKVPTGLPFIKGYTDEQ